MRHRPISIRATRIAATVLASLVAFSAGAVVVTEQSPERQALVVRHPDLYIHNVLARPSSLPAALSEAAAADLAALGVAPEMAFYDLRGGAWGTLLGRRALIPGGGNGNTLGWAALGGEPADDAALGETAWVALRGWIAAHRSELGVDPAELSDSPGITVHDGGRVVQIHGRREVGGVRVRSSSINAVLNGGNLVLYGARNWGPVEVSTSPALAADAARAVVASHVAPAFQLDSDLRQPRLELVPMAAVAELGAVLPGEGYAYRLAWVLEVRLAGDRGRWEALVDAHSGELLSFADLNLYGSAKIQGGIYPVSNDGRAPDGIEYPGYPMPFADVVQPFGGGATTNSAGLVDGIGSTLRTSLAGPYVRMHDFCGPIDEVASCGDLDLGDGPGTDCVVPPGHSPGDTHASRSGFYELNRQVESARALLPGNEWVRQQLTSNMNIDDTCNAFWDGQTINFFKSGGSCANTGEIAAVFDHEWGHGLDDNDTNGEISSPGESIADIYGILRVGDSCFGRGFIPGATECAGLLDGLGGYGDQCLDCSGVRELDYEQHESGLPHDLAWALGPVATPDRGGCLGVPALSAQVGPCGMETHCEGMVAAEVGWDLFARDLQAPPYSYDYNTALETARRIVYAGAGPIGDWYQCVLPEPATGEQLAGCNADGGYLNLLAADDDNGDLTDGTPHMAALFGAFARHQIACSTPAPVVSGCADAPTAAPAVTVTAGERSATVSWAPVAGASSYRVFRAEGALGCQFGKTLVAEIGGTSYTDEGLRDGFDYFYSVQAVGANAACAGPMSPCANVVPLPEPPTVDSVLAFREVAGAFAIVTGDGDEFLDNCEIAQLSFEVENGGTVDLHDVELVRVASTTHPAMQIVTPLPVRLADMLVAGTGPACGAPETRARATFAFQPQGLAPDETLEFEFEVRAVSAELGPVSIVGRERVSGTESDFEHQASKTFSFESGLEGWRIASGTFTAQAPGANGTATHLASSSFTAGQCDRIQSPQIRLSAASSVELYDQWATEPELPLQGAFDRANVGLFDELAGRRTTIVPDGGRTYNVSGPNGACVTQGEPGWGGVGPGLVASSWSPAALAAAGLEGRRVRLDVAYGTDPLVEAAGFQFDEVTITDFELQVADAQGDTCSAPPAIAANPDSAATEAGTAVAIDLLANDFTVSPPLVLVATGAPANGSLADNGDGTVTYTPAAGFTGTDGFTYTAEDTAGRQASAAVTVEVTEPVEPASACEPPGIRIADDPAGDTAAIAAGDSSLDLRALSFAEPFTGAGEETLVVTLEVADFTVPHPSAAWRVVWAGPDGVTRFVAVESCNPLEGVSCSYGTLDGTFYSTAGETACTTDPSGVLTVTVDKALVGLSDAVDGGEFLNGVTGISQVFVGAACSGLLSQADATSAGSYVVQTNAACSDGAPVAADDQASTEMNAAVEIDVLANDFDPDGQQLAIASATDPAHGTIAHDGASLTYTPDLGYLGTDTFEYQACDPDGNCDAAAVEVEVHCPAAPGGAYDETFESNAPGWQVQTARNELPASLPWTVLIDPFAHGATQSVRSDAVTLMVKDDRLLAPPLHLSPTSRLVFWHRFVFEGGYDGGVLEISRDGGATWIDVLAGGGSFVEGGYNGILATDAGSPIPGRAAWTGLSTFVDAMERVEVDLGAFAGADVRLRWRLAADAFAPGATPGLGWWVDDVAVTDTMEIPGSCPLPPDAADDTAVTQVGVPVTIDVLANDRDPNGDPLTVGRADAASAEGGTVTNHGDAVTYEPASGFAGTDTFTYDACDAGGACDTATVIVDVEAVDGATRVAGGGWIATGPGGSDKAHLSVDAEAGSTPIGRMNFRSGSFRAKGPVTEASFPSASRADLSGTCELANGAPCSYTLTVEDLSAAGGSDRFSIRVKNALGAVVHETEGEVGGGDYQVE